MEREQNRLALKKWFDDRRKEREIAENLIRHVEKEKLNRAKFFLFLQSSVGMHQTLEMIMRDNLTDQKLNARFIWGVWMQQQNKDDEQWKI